MRSEGKNAQRPCSQGRWQKKLLLFVLFHIFRGDQLKRDPVIGIEFFAFDHALGHIHRGFALAYRILEYRDLHFTGGHRFQAVRRGDLLNVRVGRGRLGPLLDAEGFVEGATQLQDTETPVTDSSANTVLAQPRAQAV